MEPVYRLVIAVFTLFFKVMNWPVLTRGAEHVPREGPAVIATNHVGYLDFTFVGYAAKESGRLVRFLAKKEVFDHWASGPLMRAMKHIPVDRYGSAGQALADSVAALRRGEVLGMFPEGTISRSFVPARGKTGAARMAMDAGASLVPGAVWGSQRIMTKGRRNNWQRGVAITVLFGEPIPYRPEDSVDEVNDRLMARINELVVEAARTYPQSPRGTTDRWWLPAQLGGTAPSVEESNRMAADEAAARRKARRAQRRAAREG